MVAESREVMVAEDDLGGEIIAPLKPEEKAAADKRWNEKMDYFKKIEKSALKSVLLLHHEQGEFACELEKNARVYGNRTSRQLMEAWDVSESSIYYYRRFYEKCTKAEVEDFVNRNISWRVVALLIGIDSSKTRAELVENLSNPDREKRLTFDQLEAKVKQLTTSEKSEKREKGEKVDKRNGANPKRTFDSVASMCQEFIEKLDVFMEAVEEYSDEEDEEKKEKMREAFKNADKLFAILAKKIEKVGAFLAKQNV